MSEIYDMTKEIAGRMRIPNAKVVYQGEQLAYTYPFINSTVYLHPFFLLRSEDLEASRFKTDFECYKKGVEIFEKGGVFNKQVLAMCQNFIILL